MKSLRVLRAPQFVFAFLALLAVTTTVSLNLLRTSQAQGPSCRGAEATIVGSSDDQTLRGTPGADVIVARGGDDLIKGRGGNDIICAGKGSDVVRAGAGNDAALGGKGNDELRGGNGSDELIGGAGNDSANGGDGNDVCDAETETSCNEIEPTPTPTGTASPTPTSSPTPTPSASPTTPGGGGGGGPTNNAPTDISLSNSSLPENEPSGTLVGNLSATDADAGQTHAFTLVAGTGSTDNGSFSIVGNQLRTAAILDFENQSSYSIRVRATDNGVPPMTFEKVFTITVTDTQEPPVVTASGGNTAYTENAAAAVIDNGVTVSDSDDTNMESATISITNFQTGDALGFTDTATITTTSNAGGVLVLGGSDTLANYQAALRTIAFSSTNDNPSATTTISFVVNDGDADSNTATKTIDVTAVDDDPTAVDNSAAVIEDASATAIDVLANDTDPDGGPKTISSASDPANGTVVLTGGSPGAHTGLTYQPDPNYCNNPPGLTGDTFTYTLNGGSTATVSVTVNCVDDPATAVDDSKTVNEDSGATTIDVLANDTDIDGGSMITSKTNGSNGSVAITNGGADLIYTPNTNYCSNPPGTTPDTFTYTVNGGSTATVTVTVDCVDDGPVAVDDSKTVGEDSGATTIDVLNNDTDVDGGTKTINSKTDGSNGTVVITNGGADLTYEPDPDYCNNPPGSSLDTFTYTLNGGDSGTVTVTVDCVNDAPTITAPASTSTQLDSAKVIAGVSVADVDAASDDVEFALAVSDGTLTFSTSVAGGLTAGDLTGNGTDSVVATASIAEINNSLADANGLTYLNDTGFAGASDTLSLDIDDLGNNGSGGAQTDSETMTINFNAPPIADDQTVTTDEDTEKTVTLTATDPEGDPMTFKITALPANGDLHEGTSSAGTLITTMPHTLPADKVTYVPDTDGNGTAFDSFKFRANDGSDSNEATVTIDVNAVNDAPVLANLEGSVVSFTEGDAATQLTNAITVTDVDTTNLSFATVQITGNYNNGQDVLGFTGDGTTGAISGSFDAPTGKLTLTGPGTAAQFQSALRLVKYSNTSENPSGATRTVTFLVDDGEASNHASNTPTRDITVTPVNDAPSLANIEGGALTYTEDNPSENHELAATSTLTATDVDNANLASATVQITGNYQNGQDVLTLTPSPQNGISGSFNASTGTLTLSGSSSVANYQTALRAVTYKNTSDDPSTLTRTVTFTANDGALASNSVARDFSVVKTNDAPVAQAQTLATSSSIKVTIGSGDIGKLKTGATDADDPAGDLTVSATFANVDAGANVSLTDPATGTYTYNPAAGFTGTDVFQYTVCDDGAPTAPQMCSAPANVTVTVGGTDLWFVDDSAAPGGTGRLTDPFQALSSLPAGRGTGDRIFLDAGTYATGHTLLVGEHLIGKGATGSFDTLLGVSVPGNGTLDARPSLGGTAPTLANTVNLATNSKVKGVAVTSTTNTAMANPGVVTGVDVSETTLTTTTGTALLLNNVGGTLDFPSISKNGAGTGISLTTVNANTTVSGGTLQNTTTGAVFIDGGSGNFSDAGSLTSIGSGRAITVQNKSASASVSFTGAVGTFASPLGGTGVLLDNNDQGGSGGGITFSAGVNLSTGTSAAFAATNGGIVSVTDPGGPAVGADNSLTTTSGTALNVANSSIGASGLTFRSVSANGAANGIVLNGTGANGLSVTGTDGGDAGTDPDAGTGGTIQNTTDDGVSLSSANGTFLGGLNITSTGAEGIDMDGGSGLTLTTVNNTGAGNGDNEDGLDMVNVSGTVSIQGSSFTDAEEELIEVDNNNTNLVMNVGTVTPSTFTHGASLGSFTGQAILYTGRGSSNLTLNVDDSTFTNIKLFGIQVGGDNTWTGNNVNINLDNNDFLVTVVNALGNPNNRANTVNVQGRNTVDIEASITNNLLDGGGGGGIQFGADENSTIDANITGNTVSDQFADGILVGVDENADMTLLINNNTISNTSSDGMEIANAISPGGTSTLNATITNNIVTGHNNNAGANSFFGGIGVFGGADAPDVTFVNVTGNSVSGNPNPGTFFDYALDGSSFGDLITLQGAGTGAVAEADFLGPPDPQNTSAAPAGGKTFIGNTFYSNGALVPLPVINP